MIATARRLARILGLVAPIALLGSISPPASAELVSTPVAKTRHVGDCALGARIQRYYHPQIVSPPNSDPGADDFRAGGLIDCDRLHASFAGRLVLKVNGAVQRARRFSYTAYGSGRWFNTRWFPSDFGGGRSGLCWHYQAVLSVSIDGRAPTVATTGPPTGLCDKL